LNFTILRSFSHSPHLWITLDTFSLSFLPAAVFGNFSACLRHPRVLGRFLNQSIRCPLLVFLILSRLSLSRDSASTSRQSRLRVPSGPDRRSLRGVFLTSTVLVALSPIPCMHCPSSSFFFPDPPSIRRCVEILFFSRPHAEHPRDYFLLAPISATRLPPDHFHCWFPAFPNPFSLPPSRMGHSPSSCHNHRHLTLACLLCPRRPVPQPKKVVHPVFTDSLEPSAPVPGLPLSQRSSSQDLQIHPHGLNSPVYLSERSAKIFFLYSFSPPFPETTAFPSTFFLWSR